MKVRAVVLCGGEGKRLRPLTNFFQKTMVPIGAKRRPLLEYVVRLLVHHKIHDITMLTGYRAEEIENYFGDGSRFDARINYSRDSAKMTGSAGALTNALITGKVGKFDNLVVYYGDVLSDLNLRDLVSSQRSVSADATLVLANGYTMPVGVAEVSNGIVRSLKEKPNYDIDVTTGNMIISWNAIKTLREVSVKHNQSDLMGDFIPKLLERGMKVSAYYINSFWYDIGTVEKYQNLNTKTVDKYFSFLDN